MGMLTDADEQLDAFAKNDVDVAAVLRRTLGEDRSLAKLDELLAGLGDPLPHLHTPRRPTSSLPPRRTRRTAPEGVLDPLAPVTRTPVPPRAEAAEAITAERAAPEPEVPRRSSSEPPPPIVRSSLPARLVTPPLGGRSSVPPPTAAAWPPVPGVSLPSVASPRHSTLVDAPFVVQVPPRVEQGPDESDLDAETAALLGEAPTPSAVPLPFGPSVTLGAAPEPEPDTRVGPPPHEIEAAAARERRDSVRALLDKEIDPSDFPSVPPARKSERPPRRSSRPPPAAAADDVEMLLDDDEIIEIEDDEIEEMDE